MTSRPDTRTDARLLTTPQDPPARAAGWTRHDYALLGVAVAAATLVDLLVVRVPIGTKFMGRAVPGSPTTGWMRVRSAAWYARWGKPIEDRVRVPFDFAHHRAVAGLRPKLHRLMSPGHDPLLGLVFGLRDLTRGEATLVDKFGQTQVITGVTGPLRLEAALARWLAHLLSDVFTRAGLPAPGLGALLGVTARSPFRLRPDGDPVDWNHVARWMYAQGFDLRHFLTQGVTVATVELVVRGGWLLERYGREVSDQDRRRLDDLRLAAHTLTAGGNLLKVALTRNPLHFNAAQAYAVAGMLLGWALPRAGRAARAVIARAAARLRRRGAAGAGDARPALRILGRVA